MENLLSNKKFTDELCRIGDDFSMGFLTSVETMYQLNELFAKVNVDLLEKMPNVDNLLRNAICEIYKTMGE